ncbi:MAG: ABC transporter ATP-binding protein [Flavobacterium sp.]
MKKLIKKYFENFTYFYRYLKNKLFISVALSILIGFLDGLGLTMFLPLLSLADGKEKVSAEDLGALATPIKWLNDAGISLTLVSVLLFMMFFFLLKGYVTYLKNLYQVKVQQYFIKKIRIEGLRGFRRLNYKYFISSDVGRIQNTFTGEVDRVARAYQTYFLSFQQAVMVVVYMIFAFTMDPQFAVLVTIGGLLSNFIFKALNTKTRNTSRKLTLDVHYYQGLIIQAVSNFKYLKATGHLKKYSDKLEGQVEFIEANNSRIGHYSAILNSAREPITLIIVCIVIYVQTQLLGTELGVILISLLFFYRALTSLMQMQTAWNIYQAASGSLENMTRFTKELQDNREKNGKETLTSFNSDLTLKNVDFKYGDTSILKDINISVKKNESIAFVGESGSGKTTLVNIMSGLLPTDGGNFSIDGYDATSLNMASFQGRIGYITQDPVIFNDTIFNNVTFWAEPTPENIARFREATDKAAITQYIDSLPEQDKTMLGNNGINLSGGQKQRISIARELYKDIDILILDEATSALDSDTEKTIQQNIDALKGKYTILIVAHRLSTIRNADRIVVMNKGQIVETGTFKELVERTPYFKKMVELQELT